ncbi:MAG: hypothetical protein ACP5KN_08015 [Armatimonadota bacterium]
MAKGSSRRVLVGLVVVVAAGCVGAGCGPRTAREMPRPGERREGYAYTAMLMARHPLYDALGELETALEELGDGDWRPVLEPIDARFEQMALMESMAFADPSERLVDLSRQWRESYPAVAIDPEKLAADLQTRIDWEREQAHRHVAERMAEAEAAQSRRIAQLRARLVRQQQERLINLGITVNSADPEVAKQAERERERVWDTIEAQVGIQRQSGEEALAELREQLQAEAQRRVDAAVERARATMAGREAEMRAAGSELHAEMGDEMFRPWQGPAQTEVMVQSDPSAANAGLDAAEMSRAQAKQAREEAAQVQRRRLFSAIGRLRSQIKSGTERAARVVAYRQGIDLQLLPGGSARGEDMTGIISQHLEAFWSVSEDRRS